MEELFPRVLILTVASWNSHVGSNTWASLLKDYPSDKLAALYLRDEIPNSDVCSRYFIISENRVMKSIINRRLQTGYEYLGTESGSYEQSIDLNEHKQRYAKYKEYKGYSLLLARELIWKVGIWKTKELNSFIEDFSPEIVLFSFEGYIHYNTIVEYIISKTKANALGYVWDDNFNYKALRNPLFYVYRFFQRRSIKRLSKSTQVVFSITEYTKNEVDKFLNCNSIVLTKPLSSIPSVDTNKEYNLPIKMLYTGKLIIGRDKSLVLLSRVVKELNKSNTYFHIDVYTGTDLNKEMISEIENEWCTIHNPISQADVLLKQKETDILLFLEATDYKTSQSARLSFSTKLTDYLSSGKSILAIGNINTAPIQYLLSNDAALVATDEQSLKNILLSLCKDRNILKTYAEKSAKCGLKNHSKEKTSALLIKKIREAYKKL